MKIVRRAARILACLALAVCPAIAAVTMVLCTWGYEIDKANNRLTRFQAFTEAIDRFTGMIEASGPLGLSLIAANYVMSFGVIIAASLMVMSHWNPKRVFAFWAVSVAFTIGWMVAIGSPMPMRFVPNLATIVYQTGIDDDWKWYLIWYPWYVLPLALGLGYFASLLRVFRPGSTYWLSRGMCPKCHYDLKGKTDGGCPECGWKREIIKTA